MTSLIEAPKITSPAIQQAEKAALDAQQLAADLKLAAAAREDRLFHLRARRSTLAARLAMLEKRSTSAARQYFDSIICDLLDTFELETNPARQLEVDHAFKSLNQLDHLDRLLANLIAKVKADRDQADRELAALEK